MKVELEFKDESEAYLLCDAINMSVAEYYNLKDKNLRNIELLTNQKINDWRLNLAVDVAKIFDEQIALMEYLIDQLQTLKTQ